jgi:tetratricopeptide (TPR) repeat protein
MIALAKYHLNDLDEAEALLQQLLNHPKKSFRESLLYLGRIYHARNQFQEATKYYKSYLKSLNSNHSHRAMVRDAIRRCSNGIQLQYQEGLAFVENLGANINTKYDEFGIIFSPSNYNRLYFSSARPGSMGGMRDDNGRPDNLLGDYRYDMYSVLREGSNWLPTKPLHYFLNSPDDEVVFGFNSSGGTLYYYKGKNLENGRIFVDTFRQNQQILSSDPFTGPVDAVASITAPQFLDSKTILFASRKPGGYGGFDLYQTSYLSGQWTSPQNLGPDINSAYDEITPFLAPDRQTIYFSSNNSHSSIGGFDIYKSVYNSQRLQWSLPYNLGLSVNSAGDDTHFKLAKDGYTAYFSSNRKDGFGKRDLYVAYFYDYQKEVSAK